MATVMAEVLIRIDKKDLHEKMHAIAEELMQHCYEDAALLAYDYEETDLDTRGSWRENIGAAIRARGVQMVSDYSKGDGGQLQEATA